MTDPATADDSRFRRLLESAPDAIVIVDRAGRIQIVNRQAEVLFGYPREALLGEPLERLVPERFRARHVDLREGYQRAPRTRPMGSGLELSARRGDGREVPVEISLSPLDGDGEELVTAIIRDVSERRAVEAELRATASELARSNAELEEFASVASHDLQEPLRMVASYTQLLARRYQGRLDADADEFIGFAVDGARRMQDLINDLLTYSRAGTQPLVRQEVDLNQLVDDVIAELRFSVPEAEVEIECGALPAAVRADRGQLRQLFQNLLTNATKFRGARPPVVRVSAQAEPTGGWRIAVADNGIGIEPQYAERIFALFQRLHSRADYPGTGIGLAICKKIVERHGGRIWFESRPDEGTTFYFMLPEVAP
jgi:PAS domain S-box-containing protein